MNRRAVWILMAALAVSFPALAADDGRPRNVEVELTITNESADGTETSRKFELLTLEDKTTELLAGWRVPIATTNTTGAQPAMVQSFTYQNVGVTIRMRTQIDQEGRVLLDGQVEMSDVQGDRERASAQPTIGTFQYDFEAVLADGEPVMVSRAPKFDGGAIAIVIEAAVGD